MPLCLERLCALFHLDHHLVLTPTLTLVRSLFMRRPATEAQTLNIHGGVGGDGGRSRLGRGGGGGNGEGPQLHYEINAGYLTMNNNVLSTLSGQPQSQFRAVNLGDLHLLEEIDTRKVVKRGPTHQRRKRMGSVTIQRIYSARIFGSQD
ncbi:hypothetical protein B0H19DRAFT_1374561, partial [Mycena capillaripes]